MYDNTAKRQKKRKNNTNGLKIILLPSLFFCFTLSLALFSDGATPPPHAAIASRQELYHYRSAHATSGLQAMPPLSSSASLLSLFSGRVVSLPLSRVAAVDLQAHRNYQSVSSLVSKPRRAALMCSRQRRDGGVASPWLL